jgi:hypothetical protein
MTKKNKEMRLKKEVKELRIALAVCINKPLVKQIKNSLRRIEEGKFVGKKEFLKQSPLVCSQ